MNAVMTKNDAIELLKTIISVPSFSGEENQVADLMNVTFRKYGYIPYRKGNNIWIKSRYFDERKPTLLFEAHIDTVRPNANWTTDPFVPVVSGGRLTGLGSNDTGGSIVAMLAAFIALDACEQPFNMIYLNAAEEENTGKNGVQSVINDLGKVDLALVGEPTGMQAAIAEKGLMVLDCVARGKSGHAARNEGLNAIYEALSDIEWFRSYCFPKESSLLGPVKMTVTGIQAGTLHNVVPGECRFTVDVRVNECYSNQSVFDTICSCVKCEVLPRSFSLNSSAISPVHPLVKRCQDLGLSTYGSPTTSDQAVLPFTSLKIGPGDSARSHTANEYIELEEIEQGIDIFIRLLNGFSL